RLVAAALHLPHDEEPEADQQQDGRPRVEQRRPGTRRLRLGGDLDAVILELVGEAFVLRRSVSAELRAAVAADSGVEDAGDLVARNGDRLHVLLLDVLEELGERHRVLGALELRRELPDQDPDADQHHPEQQALEGRVQPGPPKCLTFKSITPRDGSVTRKSSATVCPTTHTILSLASTTSGTVSRSPRGTLRSTKKSCNFRAPGAPSGLNRSPGRRPRNARGSRRAAAATPTSAPRAAHFIGRACAPSVPGSRSAVTVSFCGSSATSPGIDNENAKVFPP